MQNRSQSEKIYNSLCETIPGGVNSPVRSCIQMQQTPLVVDHGYQDIIVDADGHKYIDYCGSWGALIHGHANPIIINAVKNRIDKGTSFGITTQIEGELAELVKKSTNGIEKIRFVSSGTEATMTAARLARGFTNKKIIIKFNGNYHGHVDHFLVQAGSGVIQSSPTSSSAGVPEEIVKYTLSLPYNDIDACKKVFEDKELRHQIAGVILEPIAANMGVVPATHEFIRYLREKTSETNSLLIFDEVITGFRIGLRGAQDYFSITPDLTCYGKIVGGGFPAAAFGGKAEIMNCLAPLGPVYQAGTLSGNPVAMEAGLQSLKLLNQPNFYEKLNAKTELLVKPVEEFIQEYEINACIQRVGSMFTLFFGRKRVNNFQEALDVDQVMFIKFFQEMFKKGIYLPPAQHEAWFVSAAHTEEHLMETSHEILKFLKKFY